MNELDHLLHLVLASRPQADVDLIRRAYEFAKRLHKGQKRLSGKDYFSHPVEAAMILAEHRFDDATIAAALLHDVIEDCGVGPDQLATEFGEEVADLVMGVTKISTMPFSTRQEFHAENLRRMLVAMARDIRVLLIKLADRLHNMRTIEFLPDDKQKRIAKETLEIYAQLAGRMGIFSIKTELEDRCFKILDPQGCAEIEKQLQAHQEERQSFVNMAIQTLEKELKKVGIEAVFQGRSKHLYSIHQKMLKKNRSFEQVYDIMALRILVNSVRDCYGALGVVHTLWKPIPRRFKDYVATPKPNMYQAIHTTVVGPDEKPLEIQIKTHAMHMTAEEGIAAHWRYKSASQVDDRFAWLKRMLEWQQEARDSKQFMEDLKIELFNDRLFVFTPRGDIKELPSGSTPIDVAFEIHSEVGMRCAGARVNNQIVPLKTQLHNGDVVEIMTANNAEPRQDWLKIVKTPKARNKIRHYLRTKRHDELSALGQEELAREFKKEHLDVNLTPPDEIMVEVAKDLTYHDVEELYVGIGFGRDSAKSVVTRYLNKVNPEARRPAPTVGEKTHKPRGRGGMRILGAEGLLTRLSKCCNPVPGDPIIGYVTRGRGVAIHRSDCPNVAGFRDTPERILDVSWDMEHAPEGAKFTVALQVIAQDRVGLFADQSRAIAEVGGNILSADVKTNRNHTAASRFSVEVTNQDHLQQVISALNQVDGVTNVHRAMPIA